MHKRNHGFLATIRAFLGILSLAFLAPSAPALVWINEINYDDPNNDTNEYIEVAGPAGVNLSAYSLVLYNGNGGASYGTTNLSGTIPDEGCGFGAVVFSYPANGIQNGAPDGVALVSNATQVIQYLGYEGTFTAVGGPANGLLSTALPVIDNPLNDTNVAANFYSIGLTGAGDNGVEFTWTTNFVTSPGVLNPGQTIDPCGGGGPSTNIRFAASATSAGEADGTVQVLIQKTLAEGNVSGTVVLGGSATEGIGADYTVDTTNFTMNGATTSATITITINNDGDFELVESVTLTLALVTGGTVVPPSVFTVSLIDNDTPSSALFISEVVDPQNSTSARYVELFNNSENDIDLAAGPWFLSRQSNGGGTWGDIPLTNTIAAGSVYVVAFDFNVYTNVYPNAPPPDLVSGEINGNGDDGFFLYLGGNHTVGALVDSYGTVGVDGTGLPWEYTDARAVRRSSVTLATSVWTEAQWFVIPCNTTSAPPTPGEHPEPDPVLATNAFFAFSAASIGESSGSFTVTVFKTLPSGTVTGQVAVGGTATETSDFTINTTGFILDGATTSATIVVTLINDTEQEGAETVSLTLTNVAGGGIGAIGTFTLTILANDVPRPPSGTVWFNEINYNPPGTDSNEYFEIAGPAGTDLSAYQVFWYNGNDGAVYGSNLLSGVIDDEGCGFGAVAFDAALQNGPDAIALVSNGTTVVEFISYGGTFTATNGPAIGLNAYDISIVANNIEPTVQLAGSGDAGTDFEWAVDTASRGNLNAAQTITPCSGGGGPVPYDIDGFVVSGGLPSATVQTETGFVYSLQYVTNLLEIPPVWLTVDAETGTAAAVILTDTNPVSPRRFYRISAE